MISPKELDYLLQADESDVLERKASFADEREIRKAMISFANDLLLRGGGKIIIGQGPNKEVIGLREDSDKVSRKITDLARNGCHPPIPVSVSFHEREGKHVAVVVVDSSAARPHFLGECYVRQGATNRTATGAEIVVLRSLESDATLRTLHSWKQEGKTRVTVEPLPSGIWGRSVGDILEITESYIIVQHGANTSPQSVSLEDLKLGFDVQNRRPLIRFNQEQ